MQRANKIKDLDMRQSFLRNIRVNREIIAEWEKAGSILNLHAKQQAGGGSEGR